MANHFSALKRARQTATKTTTNRANTSRLRTTLRKLRESLATGDKKAASSSLGETISVLDKAASKGVIHRNTAARYKSRLSKRVSKLK